MQPACKLLGTQTYILESMRTSEVLKTGASLLSCTRNARRSQDREKGTESTTLRTRHQSAQQSVTDGCLLARMVLPNLPIDLVQVYLRALANRVTVWYCINAWVGSGALL